MSIEVSVSVGLLPTAIAQHKEEAFGSWWLYGTVIFFTALPHTLLLKPDRAIGHCHVHHPRPPHQMGRIRKPGNLRTPQQPAQGYSRR